jgi:hypothetical protein
MVQKAITASQVVYNCDIRRRRQVARQGSAKPSSWVQIPSSPPHQKAGSTPAFLFPSTGFPIEGTAPSHRRLLIKKAGSTPAFLFPSTGFPIEGTSPSHPRLLIKKAGSTPAFCFPAWVSPLRGLRHPILASSSIFKPYLCLGTISGGILALVDRQCAGHQNELRPGQLMKTEGRLRGENIHTGKFYLKYFDIKNISQNTRKCQGVL